MRVPNKFRTVPNVAYTEDDIEPKPSAAEYRRMHRALEAARDVEDVLEKAQTALSEVWKMWHEGWRQHLIPSRTWDDVAARVGKADSMIDDALLCLEEVTDCTVTDRVRLLNALNKDTARRLSCRAGANPRKRASRD